MDHTSRRFAAFDSRNFRLYFIGQTISSIGSWTQSLAVIWLVLEITNRSDRLGLATALQFLPMLLLGAPAGLLADKVDNRRLLLATSSLSGVLALTFGVVVATGHVTIWWIYALTLLLGLVLAVERPAMQAILFQLVGPELLPSGVAANSTINSVSRLIGPAMAGALIATAGVATCFFINAASYLVVVGALIALRSSDLVSRPLIGRAKGKVREGLTYVRTHPDVARPLLVMTVVGTVAYNFQTTFPSMVHFGFHRGAGSVGTAMSVSAIGSIIGGIYIAGVKPHPRRTLAIALVGFAVTCLALSVTPGFWPFVAVSILLGFASASFQSVNTVVLQQSTDPSMQGRVMALHQMAWFGSTPVGAVFMGWVIQISSPRVPFALGGLSALLCAAAVVGRQPRRTVAVLS
ncbi:MAG: putative major facilitator superfamily transporter [Ilumatobacteraceae bacterium]|nr:putative major facilitator superfamily transporter [Ilumatobacteraceae bacterium]